MKSYLKNLPRLVLAPILCMLAGYLLLVAVYCIPTSWILPHVITSAGVLEAQGEVPDIFLEGSVLDNWTDASCISVTYNVSGNNPFYNALNAFHFIPEGKERITGIDYLHTTLAKDSTVTQDHSYLWHGFRIWLRVLLIFCNIPQIRSVCLLVITVLLAVLCALLVRVRQSPLAFLPFLLAVAAYGLQVESLSLLYCNDVALAIGCAIAVLIARHTGRGEHINMIFCLSGSMMAFFSMLLMPLLGLGLPLAVWAVLAKDDPARQKLGGLVQYTVSWGLGYALTMGTKIVISTRFIASDLGANRAAYYTGSGLIGLKGRLWRVASVFCAAFVTQIPRLLAIAAVLLLIIALLRRRRAAALCVRQLWPAWIVALYPAAWCFVLYGHAEHYCTRWNYAMSLFVLLQTVWDVYDADARLARQKWWTGA